MVKATGGKGDPVHDNGARRIVGPIDSRRWMRIVVIDDNWLRGSKEQLIVVLAGGVIGDGVR